MPPLRHLWIVRNPTSGCVLADILWEQDLDTLDNYILGIGPHLWQAECHTVWTDEDDARADAEARLRAVAAGLSLVKRADGRVVAVRVPGRDRDGGG